MTFSPSSLDDAFPLDPPLQMYFVYSCIKVYIKETKRFLLFYVIDRHFYAYLITSLRKIFVYDK